MVFALLILTEPHTIIYKCPMKKSNQMTPTYLIKSYLVLCRMLRWMVFFCRVIETLQEPLGEWQNVNGTGLNMLDAFYKDPKRSLISTVLPSGNP